MGSILATLIGGIVATKFSYPAISYFIPLASLTSILGVLIVRKEPVVYSEPMNSASLIGGSLYVIFIGAISFSNIPYTQEIIFIVGMFIVSILLGLICRHLSSQEKREIFGILLVIFSMRVTPSCGPGVELVAN